MCLLSMHERRMFETGIEDLANSYLASTGCSYGFNLDSKVPSTSSDGLGGQVRRSSQ